MTLADIVSVNCLLPSAIFHDKSIYGEGLARAFRDALKELGVTITLYEGFDDKERNFRPFLPKLKEGDRQAPEGFYFVGLARMNPNSDFHLSFDLGFPNEFDRHHRRTGSDLMVHGDCVSAGCYAMTDAAIEEMSTDVLPSPAMP